MRRRTFLKAVPLAGAVGTAASGLPKPAIARGLREWRMVTSWPRGLPGVGTGAERLARRITSMSEGRLSVTLFAANELVPALRCFDAVADGEAEMGHDAAYYHLDKSEGCAFFTAFPFGFTAGELTAWIHHGGGQRLWDELYAPFGLKPFLAGNTGTQMFGWFRREINGTADLKGLRIRTPGNNGRVLARLGASVVLVAGGDILRNLQSGAIDAAEWIGPYNDLALGLHQVAPYYYAPGYHEPGAGLQLMVNAARYAALPPDLQDVVAVAAQAAHDDMLAEYTANNGPALTTLITRHKVQLKQIPRAVMTDMGNAANDVLVELRDTGDAATRRIIESYLLFRSHVVSWTRVSEQAYTNARQLPFPHGTRRA